MASDILVKVGADISDFSRKMSQSQKALSNFGKANQNTFDAFKQVGGNLTKYVTAPAAAAVSALTGITLVKGFGRLVGIDTARAKLSALGHDAESVEEIMDNALEAVRGTSYGLDEAATAAASAVAAGIEPGQELAKYLALTGDAAAIAGTDFNEMASIFGKVQTAQRAYTGELNQLADRGIPIFQWLADQAGVSTDEIRDLASQGEISAEMFRKAIEDNIGGAAQEIGEKSFVAALQNIWSDIARIGANFLDAGGEGEGFFSRLKPLMTEFRELLQRLEEPAAELGAKFGDAFIKVVEGIKSAVNWFRDLSPTMQKVVGIISAVAAIGSVLAGPFLLLIGFIPNIIAGFSAVWTIVKAVGSAIALIASPIGLAITAVVGLAYLIYRYWDEIKAFTIQAWGAIKDFFAETWDGIKSGVVTAWDAIKDFFASTWESIKEGAVSLWDGVVDAWNSTVEGVTSVWESVKQFFVDLWGSISDTAIGVWDIVIDKVSTVVNFLQDLFSPLIGFFSDYWETIRSTTETIWDNISGFLSGAWSNIKTAASSAWEIIKNVILGPILLLINLVTGDMDEFSSNLSAIWDNIKEAAKRIWESIKDTVISYIELLVENSKAIITAFVDTFVGYWTAIWETVKNIWEMIVEFVFGKLAELEEFFSVKMDSILQVISDVWNSIYDSWESILSSVMDSTSENFQIMLDNIQMIMEDIWIIIENIWNYVKETFLNATAFLKALITGDFGVMKDLISEQMTLIKETISNIWAAIKNAFSSTLKIIGAFVSEAWNNIKSTTKSVFNSVKDTILSIWDSIKKFFTETLVDIWNNVKQKFDDIKNSVKEKMGEAKDNVVNAWEEAVEFLKNIDLKQIGKDIIQGLINGIKDKIKAVGDAVKDVTDAITGKIKSILKIASPSKLLKQYGMWTGEGLADGISGSIRIVEKASDKLAKAATPEMPNLADFSARNVRGYVNEVSAKLSTEVNGRDDVQKTRDDALINAIGSLERRLGDLEVVMDGERVGRIVTPHVSRQQASDVDEAKRIRGVRVQHG